MGVGVGIKVGVGVGVGEIILSSTSTQSVPSGAVNLDIPELGYVPIGDMEPILGLNQEAATPVPEILFMLTSMNPPSGT